MRPIKLLLTAFGPYKNKEIIDFTKLAEHNLFVISGKTGSGKTTIFDGISFALYGSASGEDRENVTMLRSQFADDEMHTAVEFVFELKDRRYRVLRQIGHVKQGNKTKTGEKYEFFEQTSDGEIPRVDRQIVSEINKKIESLIGLTQDQFKQIVMLPQGEFRKFLTSETENKEAILRRLFKTEPYQEIEVKLKEKHDELKEIFNKDAQQIDSLIKNIIATLPNREESNLLKTLNEDTYNTHQVLNGLVEESKYYLEKITIDETAYNNSFKKYETLFKQFGEAKNINEQFNKRATKLKEMEELQAKQEEQTINENKLKRAQRANKLIPYELQLKELRQDLERENRNLIETEELNVINKKTLDGATEYHKEMKNKEPERDKLKIEIDTFNRYIPMVKEITELEKQIQAEEKTVKNYHNELVQLTNSHKETEQLLDEIINEIEQIESELQVLPKKEIDKKELLTDWKKLNEYEELIAQIKLSVDEHIEKKSMFQKLSENYQQAEQSWLNNEAAYLATHLHEGDACQVCGSKTHPSKAVYEEGVLSEKELKTLKASHDKFKESLQKLEMIIDQSKNEQTKSIKEIKELGYDPEKVTEEKMNIEIKGKNLAKEIEALISKRNKHKELVDKRITTRKEISEDKSLIESTTQQSETIRIQFTEKEALYTAKLTTLPEKYRDLNLIESKLKQMINQKVKLDSDWNKAEKELKNTENAYLTSSTNLKQLTKQVADINLRYSKAKQTFNKVLVESEFTSLENFENAKLSEAFQAEVEKKLEKHKKDYLELTHDLNQLNEELKNEKIYDLVLFEEEVNKLRNVSQQNYDLLQNSKRAYDDAEKLINHIKEVRDSLQKNEEALLVLTDLYDITRGHNEQKISFERFLQIEYLEQIIHAANIRLINLSNGQFNLILSERQETHGRQSGLALDVNDAYTGQTRDVKTLSGGEKFNASLALALGMSDVIQSFEGSISIDMMFIDEGFGSLDEESLTKAIDTLIDLQKSGRLIGVISHVEELKAVFPAILEVKKTQEGYSETEFKIE